jgi:hypothetical protein
MGPLLGYPSVLKSAPSRLSLKLAFEPSSRTEEKLACWRTRARDPEIQLVQRLPANGADPGEFRSPVSPDGRQIEGGSQ